MIKWIRFFGFLAVISVFFLVSAPLFLLSDQRRRILSAHNTRFFILILTKLFGMRVSIQGKRPPKGPCLVASNHLSYLDVLALYAVQPTIFITSQEVRETPFLGWLCLAAGCFFVERRSKDKIRGEQEPITNLLAAGVPVALFPEGTSSNGASVLPFKSTFFEPAVQSRANVLPVCLNYLSIGGEPLSHLNRDRLCWYGDMDFLPHFLGFLGSRSMEIEVKLLTLLPAESGWDRKQLSANALSQILGQYRPLSESGTREALSRNDSPATFS